MTPEQAPDTTAERFSRRESALLALVLLPAALMRLVGLGSNPPGPFRDEWEKGYTALELWKTGRHAFLGEDGLYLSRHLPLFIEVYAGHDRTSAIYQYLTAPFVGIFGLTNLTTRMVAALAGIAAIVAVWLFMRASAGRAVALIAAASLAFSPAGIVFSRWAQQGILVLALVPAGLWCFRMCLDAMPRHRRAWSLAGGILLATAAYAYDPARLVVPLLLAGYLCIVASQQKLRDSRIAIAWGAVLFSAIWIPLLVYTLTAGSARLSRVGVFSAGGFPLFQIAGNYFAHFDPLFLWIAGDANPRHSLPGCGLMGWGNAALALAGLVAIFTRRSRFGWFVLFAVAVSPAAAALTNEGIPHALRANLMICAMAMLAGQAALLTMPNRTILLAGAGLLLLVDAGQSTAGLVQLPARNPDAWQAGVVPALREALATDGNVYLSMAIPYASYAALFVESPDPALWQEQVPDALRIQFIAPGTSPVLRPGDSYIGPAETAQEFEQKGPILVYRLSAGRRIGFIPPP